MSSQYQSGNPRRSSRGYRSSATRRRVFATGASLGAFVTFGLAPLAAAPAHADFDVLGDLFDPLVAIDPTASADFAAAAGPNALDALATDVADALDKIDLSFVASMHELNAWLENNWINTPLGESVDGPVNHAAQSVFGVTLIGNGVNGTAASPDGGPAGLLFGNGGDGFSYTASSDPDGAALAGGSGGNGGFFGGDGGNGGNGFDGGAGGDGGRAELFGDGGNGGNGSDGAAGGAGGDGGLFDGNGGNGGNGFDGGAGGDGGRTGFFGDGGNGGNGSDGAAGGSGGLGGIFGGSGGNGGNGGNGGDGVAGVDHGVGGAGGDGGSAFFFGSGGNGGTGADGAAGYRGRFWNQ